MKVCINAGGNKIHIQLLFFCKAKQPFPWFTPFLLPQQPAKERIAAEFIFADTVTLHFALCHFERTARTFTVDSNISQITFIFQFDAHYPMPADLVFLQSVDKTGSITCDFIAQGFQQPIIQAVQLKANAAAVFHNDFGKHIIMLERSQPAAQNIQILIGHIFQMRVLQQLQRRQVRRWYDLRQMQFSQILT